MSLQDLRNSTALATVFLQQEEVSPFNGSTLYWLTPGKKYTLSTLREGGNTYEMIDDRVIRINGRAVSYQAGENLKMARRFVQLRGAVTAPPPKPPEPPRTTGILFTQPWNGATLFHPLPKTWFPHNPRGAGA